MRYIPSDAYAPIQHKLSAFNALAHRLVTLPLTTNNYHKEYTYTLEAAKVNGYSNELIDNIIKKHSNKHRIAMSTTLVSQNKTLNRDDELKRVAITFAPKITNGLKTVFRRNNMQLVYSNPFKLKNKLISTKDKKHNLDKPGVYEISCKQCKRKYYGQTKRSIKVRFKDHQTYVKNNEPRRSAVAAHALHEQHLPLQIENVRLLRSVTDERKLDAIESMHIHKDTSALNADKGNIESDLFKFC